ncbi:MAG: potassium-transporting ATPase subunit KdpA [Acidobacteria bacterium RBG_13_68_16]|nr:MAG: potassium-transporting ATPase subunit KdpA [Acidobacteria bacterium RBG_13_68_16]
MTALGVVQLLVYLAVLLAVAKPLGTYMARVYEGRLGGIGRVLGPVERFLYRIAGIKADDEMGWKRYAVAMVLFNFVGFLLLYVLLRLQGASLANPQHLPAVGLDLSFNTAISFVTNTNWQSYSGEQTMSYLTQMVGLAVQNFLSAASGMAVLVALIRGIARRTASTIGNFWVDTVRGTLYIFLPLSLILALALVSQGVVQTFSAYRKVALVQSLVVDQPKLDASGAQVKDAQGNPVTEKVAVTEQTLAVGPASSQIAIKQLGTNGGGFFNVNSAHPFENPTPLSNFLEVLAILLIPGALCLTFGEMVRDRRQGWAILAAMTVMLLGFALLAISSEQTGNPLLAGLGVDQNAAAMQSGGSMEGKEVRFGAAASALWATATTAASNGSVNSMHDSFTPLGGLVPMGLMQIGEVVFGGVGSGLYGMLAFVIVAVFVAGLMVGRTPEYIGKKVQSFEMKMASLVILIPPSLVLLGTALAVATAAGRLGPTNPGAHGFSEILYAFSSASNNNGSAFAGLNANTPFYNFALGLAMFFGRFWAKIPILAIAGSLAAKKYTPVGAGTLATHTPLFVVLLIGTVLLVGALTFFPALALGPIVEHLQMLAAAR